MSETNPTPEREAPEQQEKTETAAAQTEPQAEETAQAKPPKEPKKHRHDKAEKAAALEAAKAKLEAAEAEAGKMKDQLLRTVAEYDNFRKRSAREQDAAFNNGVGFAINQILPILDTLEMAAQAETADENYKKGVVMTLDKAAAALKALNVEEIPALGQPFNPELHAAVQQVASPDAESGTVVQVFQKGYKIGDRIVRHATVVVAE